MKNTAAIFEALSRSRFRSRFRLGQRELAYLQEKGIEQVMKHAGQFIEQRLKPASPRNDGRQTPMRGHPVFIAQHATATCCRNCLLKWHGIAKGSELNHAEINHVLKVIAHWLNRYT